MTLDCCSDCCQICGVNVLVCLALAADGSTTALMSAHAANHLDASCIFGCDQGIHGTALHSIALPPHKSTSCCTQHRHHTCSTSSCTTTMHAPQ